MISTLQLQYFCALAHKQNLTKCAEEFYISQSTLSNSLARLEADLNVQLFDRVGRNLVLNNYGKIYLEYAEAAIKALEDGKRALTSELEEQKDKVIVYTISPLLFSKTIDVFAWQHNELDITQREFLYSDVSSIDSMNPNVSVIIAGSEDIKNSNWDSYEFRRDVLCVLISNSHPLAGRDFIDFEALKKEHLILDETRTSFREFTDNAFKRYGFSPKSFSEANYSLLADILKRKPGALGITTSLTAANKLYSSVEHLSHIPIKGLDVERGFSIYWRKNVLLSDAAKAFIEYVKTVKGVCV